MATARLQEMLALTEENKAQVVLAEAEVPSALAHAFVANAQQSTGRVRRLSNGYVPAKQTIRGT